jgi:hypothetical protein
MLVDISNSWGVGAAIILAFFAWQPHLCGAGVRSMRCSCRLGRQSCRRSARVQRALGRCGRKQFQRCAGSGVAGRPVVIAVVGMSRSRPEFVAEIRAAEASSSAVPFPTFSRLRQTLWTTGAARSLGASTDYLRLSFKMKKPRGPPAAASTMGLRSHERPFLIEATNIHSAPMNFMRTFLQARDGELRSRQAEGGRLGLECIKLVSSWTKLKVTPNLHVS